MLKRQVFSRMGGEKNISSLINELRFPLAIMVVMQHSMPTSHAIENSISEYVRLMLLNVCQCAVPLFFLISGYLFFINIPSFSWKTFCNKIQSRFKSILVPYIIWNALYILFHAIQSFAFPIPMTVSGKVPIQEFEFTDYLSCFWRNSVMGLGNDYFPINIPLWYLRDLFVLILVTPVIWFLVKHLKEWFVISIAVIYLFSDWRGLCTGLSISGLLFFSSGAYLGMIKVKVIHLKPIVLLFIPLFAALLIINVFFFNTETFHHFLILIGCVAFLIIFAIPKKLSWFAEKSSYAMMIYVMQVFWLSLFNQTYIRLIGLDSDIKRILSYFVLCTLTITASVILINFGRKNIPNVMKVLGDR